MTNEQLVQKLTERLGDKIFHIGDPYGFLTFEIDPEHNIEILRALFDDLGFQFLTDLTAVHYPDNKGKELAIVYHLHDLVNNVRIRMKAFVGIDKPHIQSATAVFEAANWMERETYDFYGINFVNHPNLKRILNAEEMDYFPMRKEYPLEDQTRLDKDDAMFGR